MNEISSNPGTSYVADPSVVDNTVEPSEVAMQDTIDLLRNLVTQFLATIRSGNRSSRQAELAEKIGAMQTAAQELLAGAIAKFGISVAASAVSIAAAGVSLYGSVKAISAVREANANFAKAEEANNIAELDPNSPAGKLSSLSDRLGMFNMQTADANAMKDLLQAVSSAIQAASQLLAAGGDLASATHEKAKLDADSRAAQYDNLHASYNDAFQQNQDDLNKAQAKIDAIEQSRHDADEAKIKAIV